LRPGRNRYQLVAAKTIAMLGPQEITFCAVFSDENVDVECAGIEVIGSETYLVGEVSAKENIAINVKASEWLGDEAVPIHLYSI